MHRSKQHLYSITSSARATNVGGNSRPSAPASAARPTAGTDLAPSLSRMNARRIGRMMKSASSAAVVFRATVDLIGSRMIAYQNGVCTW
jgi:hypothetical protein